MKLDLNCDLGEGEALARTRALMRSITSANVACGGHAGDAKSMAACARLAKRYGVRLGAHPGPWDRKSMGRGQIAITPDEFEMLLLHQVGALEVVARAHGLHLHHVKLHGALYHASETNEALAHRYLASVACWWPRAKIFARAGGQVARLARRRGLNIWEEAFVDRAYQDDGSLVPRTERAALLTGLPSVIKRVQMILHRGEVLTVTGGSVRLRPQTVCVHSDTPGAVALARRVAHLLDSRTKAPAKLITSRSGGD